MTEKLPALVRENGPIVIDVMGEDLAWRPLDYGTWTPLVTRPSPTAAGQADAATIAESFIIEPIENERDSARNATAKLIAQLIRARSPAEACRENEADAARYRWLRDHSCPPHNFYISVPDEFNGVRYTPADVDAYIDAARAALSSKEDARG